MERRQVNELIDELLASPSRDERRLLPGSAALDEVGLGVGYQDGAGGYVLAVLLQQRSARLLELASALTRRVNGEAITIVTGPVELEVATTESEELLQPGTSIGTVDGSVTGTLGCFVRTQDGQLALLSNAHVLTPFVDGGVGGVVVQPGGADGVGKPVAVVTAALPVRPGVVRPVDAAAAKLHDPLRVALTKEHFPVLAPDSADVGLRVTKRGRSTGVTQGEVFVVDATLAVDYPTGRVRLRNLIGVDGRVTRFTAPGDSGALIVGMDDSLAYGLHVAGTRSEGPSGYGASFAHPVRDVLAALGATLAEKPHGHP